MKLGALAQRGREAETILYPQTEDYAKNWLSTFKALLSQQLQNGIDDLKRFLNNTPDLLWLYIKKYNSHVSALIESIEITLPRANAYQLFKLIKEAEAQSADYVFAITQGKLKVQSLKLDDLLTRLGYIEKKWINL